MSCEICGRNSCTRSFHSLDEQSDFDKNADAVKDRMKEVLKREIGKLKDRGTDENFYLVDLEEVIEVIDSY